MTKRTGAILGTILIFLLLCCSCSHNLNKQSCQSVVETHVVPATISRICRTNNISIDAISYCVVENREPSMQIGISGDLIVTTGFLLFTGDTLAQYVIAHEIAHYKLGHAVKGVGVSLGTSAVFVAANILIPGAGLLSHFVSPTVSNAFSRSQELDADVEGVRLCIVAGLPDAAKKSVEALALFRALRPEASRNLWSTHPSYDDRISHIKSQFPDEFVAAGSSKPPR